MSFKLGNKGESFAKKLFKKFGVDCQINEDYDKRYDYDLICKYGKKNYGCCVGVRLKIYRKKNRQKNTKLPITYQTTSYLDSS